MNRATFIICGAFPFASASAAPASPASEAAAGCAPASSASGTGTSAMRTSGNSSISLKTRIRSVYPTWGFVTLNGGDKAGVVLNSTLAVVRDDEVVCKLFVTTVERDSASANIVPDSIDPGVVLMVGDRVVPMETKQPKEVAPAPGTETKIPGAPGAGGAAPAGDSLEGLLNSLSQ